MAKKPSTTADDADMSTMTQQPAEDGQSGVSEFKEKDSPKEELPPKKAEPLDPSRRPAEGDTVVYVPHITHDNIGAGHCKATVSKANADGTVDLTVHGPNGDFTIVAVDRGSDQTQRSYYWGDPDEGRSEGSADVVGKDTQV